MNSKTLFILRSRRMTCEIGSSLLAAWLYGEVDDRPLLLCRLLSPLLLHHRSRVALSAMNVK
jgi:hypothetical protein